MRITAIHRGSHVIWLCETFFLLSEPPNNIFCKNCILLCEKLCNANILILCTTNMSLTFIKICLIIHDTRNPQIHSWCKKSFRYQQLYESLKFVRPLYVKHLLGTTNTVSSLYELAFHPRCMPQRHVTRVAGFR